MEHCIIEEKLVSTHLYCPTCNQDYNRYYIIHKCDSACVHVYPEYRIEYVSELDINKIHIQCPACKEVQESSTPAKRICPKCMYVGWYVTDHTQLCPVCIIEETSAATEVAKTYITPTNDINNDREVLSLYITVDERSAAIGVLGYTKKSIQTAEFYIIRQLITEDSINEAALRLKNLVQSLQDRYILQWIFDKHIDKIFVYRQFNIHGAQCPFTLD